MDNRIERFNTSGFILERNETVESDLLFLVLLDMGAYYAEQCMLVYRD